MEFGYTMMCEQSGPRELVRDLVRAEETGFTFSVISDHFSPWLTEQGHSPQAWSVLGAAAAATDHIDLMTMVTCPTQRYHPAVVAQMAATVQILSRGRFTLGLGAGENLNEHVAGGVWASADIRHRRLEEALDIIHELLAGQTVNFRGDQFVVDSAKLWDLPEVPVPIGLAVSGKRSSAMAARYADLMIATEPRPELVNLFRADAGTDRPVYGQLPICFDADPAAAVARAHEQFRWSTLGWHVNSELPGPASFAAATEFVRPEDVSSAIPCGNDISAVVDGVRKFADSGFTHLALVQIGGDHQDVFLDWSEKELLPALRSEFGAESGAPQVDLTDDGTLVPWAW